MAFFAENGHLIFQDKVNTEDLLRRATETLRILEKQREVFDELFLTIELIGIDGTIKALKEAKTNCVSKDFNVDFILNVCVQVTGVAKERILHGNDRTDERKMAISLCVYFIKQHLAYSLTQSKKIFNKDESALSRYNANVENRPNKPKTEFEKILDTNYKKINLIITEKKLTHGTNN